jgi:hypothetical protein
MEIGKNLEKEKVWNKMKVLNLQPNKFIRAMFLQFSRKLSFHIQVQPLLLHTTVALM